LGGQLYTQHYLATNLSHQLGRLLIDFTAMRKFRSFNQQQHRADTAATSQTAAMLGVVRHAKLEFNIISQSHRATHSQKKALRHSFLILAE